MGEYWKSLPRKFCDICKCWFADNKASIDFHERGKRHKENAAKRIQDIQKRGIKEAKKQKKLEDDMAKIEKAALAAYKKDIQNEAISSLESKYAQNIINNVSESPKFENSQAPRLFTSAPIKLVNDRIKEKKVFRKKTETPKGIDKEWYEGITDEGYKYYWNVKTSESKWEPSDEPYVTLEEQNLATSETSAKNEDSLENAETSTSNEEPISSIGPQPKYDPYGQWVTVQNEEPVEIDLQLPKPPEDLEEVVLPIVTDEPKFKIKEKVIGKLAEDDSSEEVTFKKRKFIGSSKRNTRQRTDDD